MGAGKTNLAVYLCRFFGYKLVCNDHALIGLENINRPYVYCGTLSTILRPGAAKLVIPEYMDIIPKSMFQNPWKTQFVLNNHFSSLGIQTSEGTYIKNVIFVNVDEKNTGNMVKLFFEKKFSRNYLKLIDCLGEFTRCNGKYLFGINKVMPNFDNDETNDNRKIIASCIAENTNVYDIRGDIKYVARAINDLD